jgi:hypothetical protein
MTHEPEFWEDYLMEEPICRRFMRYWRFIKWELIIKSKLFPKVGGSSYKWMNPYPKYKIEDPETGKKVKMYDNTWDVLALSRFSESYHHEVNMIVKKLQGGKDLDTLIDQYRWILTPVIHNIIKGPEKDGILANMFLSMVSPGTIIRPHQGYSKDYMRVHLCLVEDPGCTITVGEVTKTWKNGKILAFKDGGPYYHSVVHNGKKDRYVMSFDLRLDYLEKYLK